MVENVVHSSLFALEIQDERHAEERDPLRQMPSLPNFRTQLRDFHLLISQDHVDPTNCPLTVPASHGIT